MTGLLTWRALEAQLGATTAGSLLYIDVDCLMHVNYVLGHQVADDMLRKLADLVATACANHPVARCGGDEFLVYLEDASTSANLAETIRADAERRFAVERARAIERAIAEGVTVPPRGPLTLSIGLVDISQHGNFESALSAAVKANERAKTAGGNCVTT